MSRLEVPAWQARRVARQTHRLSKAAAIWVDQQVADRGTCGPVIVDRLVAQAIATYDPETTEDREDAAEAGWDVTLTHPDPTDFLGTSHLDATGDTLVLKELYDHVCGIAHQLYLDGDTSPLGVRKIKALGILTSQPTTTGNATVKVYARVEAHDLEPGALAVGQVEKLGTATLTKIRDWVGHHQVVIQPVLNMATPRRHRLPRPTHLDARPRPPQRRTLHLPQMPDRRQILRPRPHHPLRPARTTRPNQTRQPRRPVPKTPPRQNHRPLELLAHARRRLHLARPLRHDLPRHRPRHPTRLAGHRVSKQSLHDLLDPDAQPRVADSLLMARSIRS